MHLSNSNLAGAFALALGLGLAAFTAQPAAACYGCDYGQQAYADGNSSGFADAGTSVGNSIAGAVSDNNTLSRADTNPNYAASVGGGVSKAGVLAVGGAEVAGGAMSNNQTTTTAIVGNYGYTANGAAMGGAGFNGIANGDFTATTGGAGVKSRTGAVSVDTAGGPDYNGAEADQTSKAGAGALGVGGDYASASTAAQTDASAEASGGVASLD
mgnify:FL=1